MSFRFSDQQHIYNNVGEQFPECQLTCRQTDRQTDIHTRIHMLSNVVISIKCIQTNRPTWLETEIHSLKKAACVNNSAIKSEKL